MKETLLEVKNLTKSYKTGKTRLTAVNNVSFTLARGETLGVVGESGCGKTTLGRTVLGLLKADSGQVVFCGEDVTNKKRHSHRSDMQIIFQDPYNSVDPYYTVEKIILEAVQDKNRVDELLDKVGLSKDEKYKYPHELSGGQLQRAGIARAIGMHPKFMVCDEPVSALDVSYQSKIITLLEDLQQEEGIAYLFISHDLAVVRHIADRIAIMYRGKIVELADTDTIIDHPVHPYTHFLLSAVPAPFSEQEEYPVISGRQPNEKGCVFAYRCPFADDLCFHTEVPLQERSKNHFAACLKY